jgi:hypothetical protein
MKVIYRDLDYNDISLIKGIAFNQLFYFVVDFDFEPSPKIVLKLDK